MPIKLNPCRWCGKTPKLFYSQGSFIIINDIHSYSCPVCGFNGKAHPIYTDALQAAKEWNDGNPKEGKNA